MDVSLDTYRNELIDFLLEKYGSDANVQSDIPNLTFYSATSFSKMKSVMYEPSLCVILQGAKEVGFGEHMYRYDPYEYLLASTHIPATINIVEASKEKPYISLMVRFTLDDIYDVLKNTPSEKLKFQKNAEKGLFFDTLHISLYEPLFRLVKLLDKPKEHMEYLAPFIIKEILYILVNEKSGYFLNKFAIEGTTSNKIAKVISEIKNNLNEKLSIKALARDVQLSESTLYENFKIITSLSPIQFQKKLRLEEAKCMLSLRKIDISEVAFLVGYESPSQFSREFTRMFGLSPSTYFKTLEGTSN